MNMEPQHTGDWTTQRACNCKGCHDHANILKAHAGEEDTVRGMTEEAMRDAGTIPAWTLVRPRGEPQYERHTIIDDPVKVSVYRWSNNKYAASLGIYIPLDATTDDDAAKAIAPYELLPAARKAVRMLEQIVAYQEQAKPDVPPLPPMPVGEMAGNPSCFEQSEHATRRL